jgi:uncharacterized membrane protein YbaN (DUF454 family)
MRTTPAATENLPGKLGSYAVVIACVVVGVAGLVLPIIPGLLFLAIAAVLVARRFPGLAHRLRSHRTMGRHFASADRFVDLSVGQQVLVGALFCAKMVLQGAALVCSIGGKLLSSAFAARTRRPTS